MVGKIKKKTRMKMTLVLFLLWHKPPLLGNPAFDTLGRHVTLYTVNCVYGLRKGNSII
jgi:hypothetical protein